MVTYADLGELFKTEQVRALVAAGLALTQGDIGPEITRCLIDWSDSVREVAATATGREDLIIITYDPDVLKTPIDTCIRAMGLSRTELPAAEQAYAVDGHVLVVLPDTVIIGSHPLVRSSLSNEPRAEWPEEVALGPEQQLVLVGSDNLHTLDIEGTLSATGDHFSVRADIAFPEEATAKEVADTVDPATLKQKLLAQSPEFGPVGDLVLESWHVERNGRRVGFELRLEGDQKQAAAKLGMLAALAIRGARSYVVNAKVAEARVTLGNIAKAIAAAKPRKLTSLPAVPGRFELVQGTKYQSGSSEWAQWDSVGYTRQEPQYYQYRVDAAKNGKSAEIIAEGDLDGDGKRSRLSLTVELDPKTRTVIVHPEIEEQDALE